MLTPKEIDEIKRFADRRDLEIAVLIMARGWKWNGDHWAHSYFEPVETAQEAYEDQWHEDVRSLLTHIEEDRWIPVSEWDIDNGIPLTGYSPEWIDLDFNEQGMRECVAYCDGTWSSANWCDEHDHFVEDTKTKPTMVRRFPVPPSIEGGGQ